MIFRQIFDPTSCSYTYLVGNQYGREAILIDPVRELVPQYLALLSEYNLKLVQAVDTHLHADHITGLGELRRTTGCLTVMGEQSRCKLVDVRLRDGDLIKLGDLVLRAVHTPGHTPDSHCLVMRDRVFTGDTLLIGATGRTDFQGGDAAAQYDSLFERLLIMPDETLVYPGHDYKGRWVSSIGEEKALNPRLQAASSDEYVEIMANLKLAPPKLMAEAVPSNIALGMPPGGGENLTARDRAALVPFSGL